MNWDFADLTDEEVEIVSAPTVGRARGKPKLAILDQLTILCRTKSTGKARFRCSGDGCQTSWAAPRQSGRVLSHAVDCRFLSAELKEEALENNSDNSLGAKVAKAAASSAKARDERHIKTNHLVLELLCDASIAPKVVDNKRFRNLVNHLEGDNGIHVSTTFSANHIPAEAARVTIASYALLRTCHNLTIGFDGGTIRKGQSIYTVHITTPDDREPYFVKGDVASGVSHTGEHIRDVLLSVIDKVGRDRFAAIGSDSTGNTKLGRELVVDIIPTMLITPDPCHHGHLVIKDISALEYFSTTHLASLRVSMHINKGLEKIGQTRFGTIYWAGYALFRLLPPIHELNLQDGSKLAWMKNLREYSDFQIQLQQLCCVLEPIARAIKCLEGLQVTVGDVWKFNVAITAVLHDLFEGNSLGIPEEVQDQIRFIVNKRYKQMIEGPSGPLYLSGFYLDPEHVRSPILFKASANQLDNAAPATFGPIAPSQAKVTDQDLRDSMPTYTKVGAFLLRVLAIELKAGRTAPQFESYKTADDVLDALRTQFEAYTRQHPPFSARQKSWTKPYLYWTAMLAHVDSGVLAFVAVKIFAILPNSMPEERTVSRFTGYNSADRGSQEASSVVAMTKGETTTKPPSMNWRSIKTVFGREPVTTPTSDVDSDAPLNAEVSDAAVEGLAAVNELDTEGASSPPGETHFETAKDGVDLTIPFFRDLLSDEPVVGADKIGSLSDWAARSKKTRGTASRAAPTMTFDGEVEELVF
ncbi:ribonuclease H-like domain-containing protein [Mycena alexandri]|uniref:Ribonuclease H-like domain-containing protein n=1 Tax=Mycena alexandri TaxID=1745969 RepID=A0AAD6SBD7_9AGAR|nr:ribonuclease H-like domain-containing protein [Mycena alexandri]